MINSFDGRVWKLREDVDTDIIIATQYVAIPSIEEQKKYAFEPLRPELANLIRPGDIIVAGKNFGCGSSREQAPAVIAALGIRCVIAPSFARIFFRNSFNNGLLLIENPDLHDFVEEGDMVKVELNRCIICKDREFAITAIPDNLLEIVRDGGLVKNMRKRNGL